MAGLDMAPHVVKRSQSMKSLNLGPWPPAWKPPSGQSPSPALPQDYLYDLYAVCNHHGGMHGGHYTGTHSHPATPLPRPPTLCGDQSSKVDASYCVFCTAAATDRLLETAWELNSAWFLTAVEGG